ncbi:MAG: CsiV family protein [Pseudomonadota bacterium]
MFSQEPRGSAVEEAVYSDRLLADDPETLLQFSNIEYAPPAWFVRPEQPDNPGVVLFEDLEDPEDADLTDDPAALDDAAELINGAAYDADPLAAAATVDPVAPAPEVPLGEPSGGPGDGSSRPLSAEQRRALALAAAEANLAERIDQDRATLEAQLLSFADAGAALDAFALKDTLARVAGARGMQVLFAGSWLTEPTPRDALAPLWLQLPEAGLALIPDTELELSEDASSAPVREQRRAPLVEPLFDNGAAPRSAADAAFGQPASADALIPALPRHPIEGTIAVSKGRYLHAALQLVYDDPLMALPEDPDAATTAAADGYDPLGDVGDLRAPLEAAPQSAVPAAEGPAADSRSDAAPALVHLAQRRRMKSGELHYIDHPRLGVLIRIDPIAVPEETAAAVAQVAALKRLTGQK